MDQSEGMMSPQPIPAPRRLYPDVPKCDYENVSIDVLTKNLNIIDDNNLQMKQIEKRTNVKPVQVLKLKNEHNEANDKGLENVTEPEYGPNANEQIRTDPIYATPTPMPRPRKVLHDDGNADGATGGGLIYENAIIRNSRVDFNDSSSSSIDASMPGPTPPPKPLRKVPELPPKNNLTAERRALRHSVSSEVSTTSSSYNPITDEYELFDNNNTLKSASNITLNSSSETSGDSSNNKFKSPSPRYVDLDTLDTTYRLNDDVAGLAVASEHEVRPVDDTVLSDPNDNDLLKSLGNTSKLLTKSIGERMAVKAKGAKQVLDKNLKTSSELLSNLSVETSSSLKRFGTNFTLGRGDKTDKSGTPTTTITEAQKSTFFCERPQTMPPNDQVFNTISFSSPLNKNKMVTSGMMDLSVPLNDDNDVVYAADDDGDGVGVVDNSYDLPKSMKKNKTNDLTNSKRTTTTTTKPTMPPTYEESLRNRSISPTSTKVKATVAASSGAGVGGVGGGAAQAAITRNIAIEAAKRVRNKELPKPAAAAAEAEAAAAASARDSLIDMPSLPMPNYPPPALPSDVTAEQHIYGKLLPSDDATTTTTTTALLRNRNSYEEIRLRNANGRSELSQLRAVQVDSVDLAQLNRAAETIEREASLMIRRQIEEAEANTPKPDRSESWEFYADNHDDEAMATRANVVDGNENVPEPLYVNNEMTYGRLFEMATINAKDVLKPQHELVSIREQRGVNGEEGAVGGVGALLLPPKDIINEFDPLLRDSAATTSSHLFNTNKSNELLLLEHLLEEETYGTMKRTTGEYDLASEATSEEDNGSVVGAGASASAVGIAGSRSAEQRGSVALSTSSDNVKQPQIVHQNAQLLSDSMENMLDEKEKEARIQKYLCRVDEQTTSTNITENLSTQSQSRSHWFLDDCAHEMKEQKDTTPTTAGKLNNNNNNNKLNIEGDSLPTYLEAITSESTPTNATHVHIPPKPTSKLASRLNPKNMFSNVRIRVDAIKRRTSFRAAQRQEANVKVALQMVPRPSLSTNLVRYEGPLIRFPSGVVEDILNEMQNRKGTLRDRKFLTFLEQDMRTLKESIPLEHITTLQCVSNNRVTDNSTHIYCFEITTAVPKNGSGSGSSGSGVGSGGGGSSSSSSLSGSNSNLHIMSSNPNLVMTSGATGNCKHQRVTHLYGVGKESERGVWMQKLLESLTSLMPMKYMCHYYRAGWCYLKTSISSEWSGAWIVLRKTQRRLIFVTEASGNVEKMDLRKARCIVANTTDTSIVNLHVESGPVIMIDCPPFTVHMIMSTPRETKIWRHILREVAHNNGFTLNDQQLTKFNVPVIVDKCINFVYIHGSMSEGIYRKSGSENSIMKLMSAFRADAYNVEITRHDYNEHDVGNVLKRFMRDLPERLLGKLSDSFICVTELQDPVEKIPIYKELLARLNVIEYETLKRIVAHLVFISSQRSRNKMSVQNLTMIWGPTLLAHKAEEMVYSQKEADVLSDLIRLYRHLFPISEDEMQKEQAMLNHLQKYYASAETQSDSVKKSGDLKVWIQLHNKPIESNEENEQVSATITPTKTAYEICRELSAKMKLATHQITLYEVILNGSLERPLHHDTKVFDVILNWTYWPEEDRKDNYLVAKPLSLLREVQRAIKNLATVTPGKELKFVDNRSKSFKTLQCELRDNKIVVSRKEKQDKATIMREIFLHSSTAYLGCERKRDFQFSWSITFVERTQTQMMRSRDSPFIGHVLAGTEWVDRTIWFSSIWYCLYGDNILPPAEIILK